MAVVGAVLVKVGLGAGGGGGGTLEVVPLQPAKMKTRKERTGKAFQGKSFIYDPMVPVGGKE